MARFGFTCILPILILSFTLVYGSSRCAQENQDSLSRLSGHYRRSEKESSLSKQEPQHLQCVSLLLCMRLYSHYDSAHEASTSKVSIEKQETPMDYRYEKAFNKNKMLEKLASKTNNCWWPWTCHLASESFKLALCTELT